MSEPPALGAVAHCGHCYGHGGESGTPRAEGFYCHAQAAFSKHGRLRSLLWEGPVGGWCPRSGVQRKPKLGEKAPPRLG